MICRRCNEDTEAPGEVGSDCMRWRSNKRESVCVEREVSFASDMVDGDGCPSDAPTLAAVLFGAHTAYTTSRVHPRSP